MRSKNLRPKNSHKKRVQKIRRTILVCLLAAISVGGYIYIAKPFNTTPDTTETTKTSTKKPQKTQKKATQTKKTKQTTEKPVAPSKTPPQYEGPNPNTLDRLTGSITHASVNSGTLVIRTNIDQTISGECKLILSSPNKTITKTAPTINNPSSSSCQGFDIPVSELGSGNWQIKIIVTTSNKTGIISGSTTIK